MNDNMQMFMKLFITLVIIIISIIFWTLPSINNTQSLMVTSIMGVTIIAIWVAFDE